MTRLAPLRIGTRGSPLALAQTHQTRDRLMAAHPQLAAPGAIEIVVIKTTGDQVLDRPLAEVGGKGLFTKEIDEAMLAGSIDLAVHSMKDVPTVLPDGIVLPCMLEREDPRDVFLSNKAADVDGLPAGAVVGTASLRRQAQILARRPDLKVTTFRGNVQSRLRKLEAGAVDATLLALAGLNRLGLSEVATGIIPADIMLPAVGQGAVGITCRAKDAQAHVYVAALNHPATYMAVVAERALLRVLDGSCRTPIAALAELSGDRLSLRGLLASPDGRRVWRTRAEGAAADAGNIGHQAGLDLRRQAG